MRADSLPIPPILTASSDVAAPSTSIPCPACGAEAQLERRAGRRWSARTAAPSRRRSSARATAASIEEHDLVAALRSIPDDDARLGRRARRRCSARAARRSRSSIRSRVAQRCEFCGSPAIVPYERRQDRRSCPRACCRSRSPSRRCASSMREWYGSRWFAPNRLKTRGAHRHGARPLHSLLDVRRAGRGALDGRGRLLLLRDRATRRSKTEQVRKVRWEPAAGALDHFFDDELVPATQGRPRASCCARSSRFRRQSLVPYDAGLRVAAGWSSSTRSTSSPPRRTRATRMDGKIRADVLGRRCRATRSATCRSTPTTRGRPSSTSSCRSGCVAYTYGARTYQVVING